MTLEIEKIFFKTNIIKFKWNWWEKTMQLFISITNFISSCSVKMMIMDWRNSFIHILWNVKCKNIFENDMFKLKVDIQSTLLILFCWNFQVFLHTLILTPTINNKTDSKIREIREIKWNERRKTKTKQRPRWVLEWNGSTLWQQIKLTHIHTYIHTGWYVWFDPCKRHFLSCLSISSGTPMVMKDYPINWFHSKTQRVTICMPDILLAMS